MLIVKSPSLHRFENENRQLHQVIQQLRQTRKQQSGEAENALQELVQLRVFSEQCRQENHALELKLTNYNRIFAEHAELSARNVELERQVTRLDAAYQETKRYLLSKEKECSDLQVTVDVSQSELKMLQQDNNQRQLEVTNLRDAMSSLESDYHQLLLQHKQQHHELTQVRAELDMQISKDKSTQLQHELEELQKKVLVAEQLAQDQVLVSRQAQWEFQKEKERLQANLEGVIRQLQNSSQDVIDRALVANLVVSYFQRRRSREVLELIAKVLAFNEEQLVAVGLRVPPINIFASLLQTVIGPAEPVKVEVCPLNYLFCRERDVHFITQYDSF